MNDENLTAVHKESNWACIGCGHIANEMAQAFAQLGKSFYCVAGRTKANTDAFAEKYNIKKVYDDVDDIFRDDQVDIVYIATPHNKHIDYIVKAANAGKHILCEKAITLNSDELKKAVETANENGVVLAEAMTIFHMPVYKKVLDIIQSGKLGSLKLIQVCLGSNKEYDMSNRFFNMDLAGGAMLDIGVYALSFARFFMSETASDIQSIVKKAPTGADEQAGIVLCNHKNEMATVTLSLTAKLPKIAVASFDNGYIAFENYNRAYSAEITYNADGHSETITTPKNYSPLCYEILDMEKAVYNGQNTMFLDYTKDVMDIMTQLRYEWGMKYPEEQSI